MKPTFVHLGPFSQVIFDDEVFITESRVLRQGNLIGAGGAPDFFSNLSIFEIEKCFIPLFGNLGLQFLPPKKILKNFDVFLVFLA